jgi:uncharacterized protein DUF4291
VRLSVEPYALQVARWPKSGRHILAQFDADTIVVYQAYRPEIGLYAARHGRFGDGFSMNRMSWIKPNFLWMMYRSGWGTKEGQEFVLAIRLRRSGFDEILASAVHSTFDPTVYASQEDWKKAGATSSVRLQWDPDHHPSGAKQERRAIQLGLEGAALRKYVEECTVEIEDVSSFVAEQRQTLQSEGIGSLKTPVEHIYPVADKLVAARLGL